MTVDTGLIGETAARLMDDLPGEADGDLVAVGIVCVVDAGDETYTRIVTSCDRMFETLGLFTAAVAVAAGDSE